MDGGNRRGKSRRGADFEGSSSQMVANIRVNRSARNLESRDIRRFSGGIHPTSRTKQRQTLVRGYEAVH